MASRDFAPNHPACLQKLGTDCCEEYFSSNGSFVINKHNYTIMDMFKNLSNMNYLQRLFADDEGPENPKKHRKGENIWHKGHKVDKDRKPDLNQYPTNDDMVRAWEEGIRMSQQELISCGVGPANTDENDRQNAWFYSPHTIDKKAEKEINDLMHEEETEVENEDSDPSDLSHHEDSISMDNFSELGLHFRSLADQLEEDTGDQTSQADPVKLTVNVPGVGEVHKSTLVGMLNNNPTNISTDRLKRVKSRVALSVSENIDGNEIALFDDAAFYIKNKGNKATFILGKIIRIRNCTKSKVEYKQPVSLNKIEKFRKLRVLVRPYDSKEESASYKQGVAHKEYLFSNIIAKVNLSYQDDGSYLLNSHDNEKLMEFLHNVNTNRAKHQRKQIQQQQQQNKTTGSTGDHGDRFVYLETASERNRGVQDGVRRSVRDRRRVVIAEL
eukprot:Seg5017.2 transcript_id=Seg5017.2/GoldUCD/mRNA.D3Y31 product="hypothetical protein" protein_id=Seg5017.2/GoldUCD/D3Y31